MKHRLTEKGQAIAEYMPLIPPILLLSVVILIPLANSASDMFCMMVNAFDPAACEPVEVEDELTPEEDVCTEIDTDTGAATCSHSGVCAELPGINEGTYWHSTTVEALVIKAGKNYFIYESGLTDDGCYVVNVFANYVEWERTGGGKDCKDISHLEAWEVPVCLPSE
jgi:hypothetical protein